MARHGEAWWGLVWQGFFSTEEFIMRDRNEKRPWELAVESFLAEQFRAGQVIPHAWFYSALGIEVPTKKMAAGDAEKLKLQYASQFELVRRALLEDHSICLKSKFSKGYEWVLPVEQADRGVRDMHKAVARDLARGLAEARHVNTSALSHAEQRRQRDLARHAADIADMMKGPRKAILRELRAARLHKPEEPEAEAV
jgi:hypothetical protein